MYYPPSENADRLKYIYIYQCLPPYIYKGVLCVVFSLFWSRLRTPEKKGQKTGSKKKILF